GSTDAAGSPKPKTRKTSGVAASPTLNALNDDETTKVRNSIKAALKGDPSLSLSLLIAEGKSALTFDSDLKRIRDDDSITPGELADIRKIATEEKKKVARSSSQDEETEDESTTSEDEDSSATGTAAQQYFVPMAAPMVLSPVQLFVPAVHKCGVFCRH